MSGDLEIIVAGSSLRKTLARSVAGVVCIVLLNAWPEPAAAQPQCADLVGHLTATPSTIDRETSPSLTTNLMWSVDVKRCPAPPIVTLERRSVPPERHTVPLSGRMSTDVARTTVFALRAQNRDLASATVTVKGDPGFITVSFGKTLTPDDITKFNQQWMQPFSTGAALEFARSTLSSLDSSGATATGERMAAMVRMFDLTHDTRYLDHLLDLVQLTLKFRDDRPLDSGPNVFRPPDQIRNKVGLPAWGGGLLDNYGLHSVDEIVSSLYAYPIAAFARIIAQDPALQARYECKIIASGPPTVPVKKCSDAIFYANSALETVQVFLPQLHRQPVGNLIEEMLTHPAEYATKPSQADCDDAKHHADNHEPGRKDRWTQEYSDCLAKRKLAGKPMPHNINLTFSLVLIELSRVLDTSFYLQSPRRAGGAEDMRDRFFVLIPRQQRYFVDHLNPAVLRDQYDACKRNFCWRYSDHGAEGVGYHPEDTDHGSIDMSYVGLFLRDFDRLNAAAARFHEAFSLDLDKRQRLARTFAETIAPNTNVTGQNFKHDVAGQEEKSPADSNSRCEGWLELTRADAKVWDLCREMSLRIVDGRQPYLGVGNHSALLANKQFLP